MEHPKDNQRRIIREIFKYSDAVVVMIDPVVKRLETIYGVDSQAIAVIHHGVRHSFSVV